MVEAYHRLLAVLPEAVLLVTPEGDIRFANPPAAELLCGAPALASGRRLAEFAAADTPALQAYLRSCARSGQPLPGALTIRDAAGKPRALRAECAVVEPGTGRSEALMVLRLQPKETALAQFAALNLRIEELNVEIARRRRAEQALHDERELLRVTLSSIGDAVISTDGAGRVTFMNPIAEEQTGWTLAEASGRALDEVFVIINEDTRLPVESPVRRVLRENVVVGLANHTLLVRRDGTAHPIDDAGAPIRDAEGKVFGVVLVFRDVTERRALERERAEAERRKDEFLAMLAHELRNPLAAIAAGVEVLRRPQTAAQRETVTDVSAAMHRQVRQLARLVDDLLDVSRISTGKVSLRRQPVALDAVVEDALAAHRGEMQRRGIALSWEPPTPPPRVSADPERLAQVIGNLLSNAVKFTPQGGRVSLSAGIEDGEAFVRVVDTGEGIAPQLLDSIFELFMQGDTSLARPRGGLGIGLTVAKLITELHGGRIEAKSAGAGQGAEFIVRLALQADAAAPAASVEQKAAAPAPARRVLIVDDNADAGASLALLLQLSGHEVRVAHDGPQALRMNAEAPAEIVLLDLGMPGMNGYEVAQRLRENRTSKQPRIYALTGYGGEAERARVLAAGFDGHLTKPVDLQRLEALLAAAT